MELNEALQTLKENGYLVESEISDTIQNYFNHEVMKHRENLKKNAKRKIRIWKER